MPLDISIIVPLAPDDKSWMELLLQFPVAIAGVEILIASSNPQQVETIQTSIQDRQDIRLIEARNGRAQQMNDASLSANGLFLWFLHADTIVPSDWYKQLNTIINIDQENTLWFFRLGFTNDGPKCMFINTFGVYLRSECLGMPFGDQAFFIRRKDFVTLGGYDESLQYGEDHLLAWQARLSNMTLQCIKTPVKTSARKYEHQGWRHTTAKHLSLTWKQAFPQWRKLLKMKSRALFTR